MPKTVKLLLTESVDNLGIVGDLVTVRTGYARNFLLPRALATAPSDEAVQALAAKRADAERRLGELRAQREQMVHKLDGLEITMQRPCNDQGVLYASVTQQEIAAALEGLGFPVKPRDVRLTQNVKRIDSYEVHIRFESDLEATVKLWVVADRKLDVEKREDMEFDEEGNLLQRPAPAAGEPAGEEPRPRRKRREPQPEAPPDEQPKPKKPRQPNP